MIARIYHHLLLVAAFAALVISGCFLVQQNPIRTRSVASGGGETPIAVRTELPEAAPTAAEKWQPVSGVGPAKAWRFDLFTPPPVYRDRTTNRFELLPIAGQQEESHEAALADSDGRSRGAAVKSDMEPRIQLLGYVRRESGDVLGVFQNLVTGEVKVAMPGPLPPDWQATLKDVRVESAALISGEFAEVQLPRARAMVYDRLLERSYWLASDASDADRPETHETITSTMDRPGREPRSGGLSGF